MAVYVDDLRRINGKLWCHMLADTDAELISMRAKLHLHPSWQHNDHFDLSPWKRKQAIEHGAISVTTRDLVTVRRKRQNNG